jgi:predicted nucleic acid-binding protein
MKVEPYQPVVIDTNVWLSAAITRNGTAALLCGLLFKRHCQPAFSQSTFDELASRLITGDKDLLCLDPLVELRILTPRQALDELEAGLTS